MGRFRREELETMRLSNCFKEFCCKDGKSGVVNMKRYEYKKAFSKMGKISVIICWWREFINVGLIIQEK